MTGVEMLVEAILDGKLSYYRETGSTAYVVRYEDGKQEIVYNALTASHSRPDMNFEIVASAKWEDRLGNPQWTIYDGDDYDQAVAAIATNSDGTADIDVYYYPV